MLRFMKQSTRPDRDVLRPELPRGTLFISSLAVFAVFLDTTALFVAFPDITRSFPDVAASQLSWVLNGYTIVFAALLIRRASSPTGAATRPCSSPARSCSPSARCCARSRRSRGR